VGSEAGSNQRVKPPDAEYRPGAITRSMHTCTFSKRCKRLRAVKADDPFREALEARAQQGRPDQREVNALQRARSAARGSVRHLALVVWHLREPVSFARRAPRARVDERGVADDHEAHEECRRPQLRAAIDATRGALRPARGCCTNTNVGHGASA